MELENIFAFVLAIMMGILVSLFFPIWAIVGMIYIPVKVALKAYNDFK